MKRPQSAERLAQEFSRILRRQLAPWQVRDAIRLNDLETNANVCHSHDYCDANMCMHEAGKNLELWDDDANVNDFADIWNEAWDLAKRSRFSTGERCQCSHLISKHRITGECFVPNCACRDFRLSNFYTRGEGCAET